MIGAIAGDIIGSVFERNPVKTKAFPLFSRYSRFTDDTVLTVAVAEAIINGQPYLDTILDFARRYPDSGYGGSFRQWMLSPEPRPYNSWGNGSAMRVCPVGFLFSDTDTVLAEAEKSAAVSHDHPEGIRGAQAVALCVFLARTGEDKDSIRSTITRQFGYDLVRTVDEIRPGYTFDVSCQGSVPEAIICFLDSHSWEDAVRSAVSLGGDSDTLACMAGGMAEACYGLPPDDILTETFLRLPGEFRKVIDGFYERFGI